MTKNLEFHINKEWADCKKKNPWLEFIPEFAEDSNGQKFMRPSGRSTIYKIVTKNGNNQAYVCNDCNSEIKGTQVAHSIHDGPFPGSGSGRVKYEQVPYCPNCEKNQTFMVLQ